jgi:hypothetical protein
MAEIRLTERQLFHRTEDAIIEEFGHPIERGLLDACYRERQRNAAQEDPDPSVAVTVTLFDKPLCRELGVTQEKLSRARRYLHKRGFFVAIGTGKRGSGSWLYVLPRVRREL